MAITIAMAIRAIYSQNGIDHWYCQSDCYSCLKFFGQIYSIYSEAFFDFYRFAVGVKSARAKPEHFLLHCKSVKIEKSLTICSK